MNGILNTGKSGLSAFQRKIDVIAENISNLQTSGYKKMSVDFETLLKDEMNDSGIPQSAKFKGQLNFMGTGVKNTKLVKVFSQGDLNITRVPSDLAIQGNGFFGVHNEGDLLLRRSLRLNINDDGELLDADGNFVAIENGKNLKPYRMDDIKINTDGTIICCDDKNKELELGRLILYDLNNKDELSYKGDGYYKPLDQERMVDNLGNDGIELGDVKQGYVESSNVEIAKEMTDMLMFQRAYQLNTKSLETADEMWAMANNLMR